MDWEARWVLVPGGGIQSLGHYLEAGFAADWVPTMAVEAGDMAVASGCYGGGRNVLREWRNGGKLPKPDGVGNAGAWL